MAQAKSVKVQFDGDVATWTDVEGVQHWGTRARGEQIAVGVKRQAEGEKVAKVEASKPAEAPSDAS